MASGGHYERGFQRGKLFAMRAHHRLLNGDITHEEFSELVSEEARRARLAVLQGRQGVHNTRVEEQGYADGILSYRRDMGV